MEKTVGLLLMIGLGLALQRKVSSAEQLKGLKVLILSIALPATIFVALLNVQLSDEMLWFPVGALILNGILLAITTLVKPLLTTTNSRHRTLMMLLPSFAPGLSCFPFIAEYLGDESLALAALADVGNKVFVLILLYILAMHWYHQLNHKKAANGKGKQLVIALISEPINMVIAVALVMLSFGFTLQSFPESISSVILRLSSIMAPLILLFIGLAVKITRQDFALVIKGLLLRSGIMFIVSAIILAFLPEVGLALMLLIVVFPQSSCSFWPFAHMSSVSAMEAQQEKTFDVNFALSTLAISLPFSTLLILATFSFQSFFTNLMYLWLVGGAMILMASFGFIRKWSVAFLKGVYKRKYVAQPLNHSVD